MIFKKLDQKEKDMMDALRKMEMLKVSKEGAIYVSPHEIVKRKEFIESRKNVINAIENS